MKKYYLSRKSLLILAGTILASSIFIFVSHRSISVKPHIIIIVIDALRPDHLGYYGYKRDTSPNIDGLTRQGTVFTQAITAGGCTAESVPSILTGTYPFIHGINAWYNRLNPDLTTLPQFLESKGYESALFTNHLSFRTIDIKADFDIAEIIEPDDRQLTLEALDWIRRKSAGRFFLYLHYKGAHAPYELHEPYKNRYIFDNLMDKKEIPISEDISDEYKGEGMIPHIVAEDNISDISYYIAQYDGAISYTDTQIGYLMDSLEKLDLLDDTLVILTADHGEMLGEHDYYFCHRSCYENILKVPLIVRFPKLFPEGEIVSQLVSLIDITPTVLDILDISRPSYIQGRTLLDIFEKGETDLHPHVYTSHLGIVSIRDGTWKLIRDRESRYELYNIIEDPSEQHNLISEEKDRFRELKRILEAYEKKAPSLGSQGARDLTDEQKDELKSLGYL